MVVTKDLVLPNIQCFMEVKNIAIYFKYIAICICMPNTSPALNLKGIDIHLASTPSGSIKFRSHFNEARSVLSRNARPQRYRQIGLCFTNCTTAQSSHLMMQYLLSAELGNLLLYASTFSMLSCTCDKHQRDAFTAHISIQYQQTFRLGVCQDWCHYQLCFKLSKASAHSSIQLNLEFFL